MTKPKAQTIQQRFGFQDDDLKTATHDEIMVWLDNHSVEIAKAILGWSETWQPERVDELRKQAQSFVDGTIQKNKVYIRDRTGEIEKYPSNKKWFLEKIERAEKQIALYQTFDGLGDAPRSPRIDVDVTWEFPISVKNYIIGFIDLKMKINFPVLKIININPDKFEEQLPAFSIREWEEEVYKLFEVKTSIPSVGELIRQVNMYREYTRSKFYIVSPDDKFVKQLLTQDIGFIKYPTGKIYNP